MTLSSSGELHTASCYESFANLVGRVRDIDSSLVTNTKRTSGQAGLDNSLSKNIKSSPPEIDSPIKDHSIRPLPKSMKCQSLESLPEGGPSKQVEVSFAKFMEKYSSFLRLGQQHENDLIASPLVAKHCHSLPM
jgi:hypothetical protein